MELLGNRNWWLPAWLDRLLPNIDVEGQADHVEELVGEGPDDIDPDAERALIDA